MKAIEQFNEHIKANPNSSIWEGFASIYSYKNAPIEDTELLNLCKLQLSKKLDEESTISWLSILKHLEKPESFNPEFLTKYFRARNNSINHSAVNSLTYSKSEKVQQLLIDIIENPKSDELGEVAVKVLHFELTSIKSFNRLIRLYNSLKKETKRATWYLIFTKSFNNSFNYSKDLLEFLESNKVKSLKKWNFKNWKYLKRDLASQKLVERLSKLKKATNNKTFKNEIFYIPISDLSYILIRAHIDYENQSEVKFDIGQRSFIRAFFGRIDNGLFSSFSSLNQGMITIQLDQDFIEKLIKDAEEEIIEKELYIKQNYHKHSLEPAKKSFYPFVSFITYSLLTNNLENAKKWANYWKENNEEWLQEYWLRFCNEVERVTIANTGYDGMPPIVGTSTYP
ncbi:hypothetical protein [Portibacter lacus]|uniref:Uncharacterized protein n=1 Tax=Portibacter lacus TaxID=1099794 RepID=A0AA37WGB9_9BACT|nr:hypothetical protein [Portibacter lacus]GLR19723.1 hypothetical protein GCM10007940_43390 [Portibacter lacus]